MAYDERTAERIRQVLVGRRNVAEKKMIGGLSFLVNGNMCCSVSGRGGILVRVDDERREAMLAQAHVRPAMMGTRTMSGFVRVDPDGYRTAAQLKRWVERGLAVALALPRKT